MGTQPNLPNDGGAAVPPRDLRALISHATADRPASIRAHTFLNSWASASKPVALLCDGSQTYVVKALQVNNPSMARVTNRGTHQITSVSDHLSGIVLVPSQQHPCRCA